MEYKGYMDGVYLDLAGNPIERTPETYPYAYDAFAVYKSEDYKETDSKVYSDRLLEWDPSAFKAAVCEVWPETPESQMFSGKKPGDIQRFLSLYLKKTHSSSTNPYAKASWDKKDIKLTAVMQGCNVGNGFPYWIFAYREIKAKEEK